MSALHDFCAVQKGLSLVQEFYQLLTYPKCSDLSWKILGVPVSFINAGVCCEMLEISIKGNRRMRKVEGMDIKVPGKKRQCAQLELREAHTGTFSEQYNESSTCFDS
jgi:hypothetical protein